MKRLSKNIIGLLSCSFLLTACIDLSGRNPNFKIYEDGYFQYIHLCDNSKRQDQNDKSLVIVGFSESGMEQETLDIPSEINGYQVKRIGLSDHGHPGAELSRHVKCSKKLNKVFVPSSVVSIQFFEGEDVSFMICDEFTAMEYKFTLSHFKNIYLYSKRFKELNLDSNYIYSANVSFEINYQADNISNLYRIDNVEDGEKITIPPTPVREGYSFAGWYTEPDCTNIWDFNVSPNIEDGHELVLYAGWNTL